MTTNITILDRLEFSNGADSSKSSVIVSSATSEGKESSTIQNNLKRRESFLIVLLRSFGAVEW